LRRKIFANRVYELTLLNKIWNEKGFALVLMYGRRRVGKTRLLMEFSSNKKCIYYTAIEGSYERMCEEFSKIIKKTLNMPVSGDVIEVIEWISEASDEKLLIIIDEFQYLAEADPSFLSRLQRSIDNVLINRNLLLVLCGSSVSFFQKKLLGYRSPIFGRRAVSIKLSPLKFRDIHSFFPEYSIEDLVKVYGIVGGTPAYLLKLDPQKNIEENLYRIIVPNEYLYDEAINFLRQEVREPKTYFNILLSIAEGVRGLSAIARESFIDARSIVKYIALLEELDIVERIRPLGCRRPVFLDFKDNYFRFWFSYIYKYRSMLESGLIDETIEEIVDTFNIYLSKIFEKLVIEIIPLMFKAKLIPVKPVEIGRWWHKDIEIDCIIRKPGKMTGFIEVKWRNISFNEAEGILMNLEKKSVKTGLTSTQNYYFLICKNFEEKTPVKIDEYKIVIDLNSLKSIIF